MKLFESSISDKERLRTGSLKDGRSTTSMLTKYINSKRDFYQASNYQKKGSVCAARTNIGN